jgi:hypothetical protein
VRKCARLENAQMAAYAATVGGKNTAKKVARRQPLECRRASSARERA